MLAIALTLASITITTTKAGANELAPVKGFLFTDKNSDQAYVYDYEKTVGGEDNEYTVYVPDAKGNNLFIKVLSDEGELPVKSTFTNLKTGQVSSNTFKTNAGKSHIYAVKYGSIGNTINLTVTYQEVDYNYVIHVERIPTLASLSIETSDSQTLNFDKTFNFDTYEYLTSSSVNNVTVNAVPYDSKYSLYINGANNSKVSLSDCDGKISVRLYNPDNQLYSKEYLVDITRLGVANITFNNPAGATIFLKDSYNQRINPNANGVFSLSVGDTYSYTVSKYGYISLSGEITPTGDDVIDATLSNAPASSLVDISSEGDWPLFRADENNNGVVNYSIPTSPEDTTLYWAKQVGEGYSNSATGCPILVDGYIYTYANKTLLKIDSKTGNVIATGEMADYSSFSINSPTYAMGMVFVALKDGQVQAFNAVTLESLWLYKDELGGQPNSPIVYKNGYIYTGFWNSEKDKKANFVCLSITDEDPTNRLEEKKATFSYTHNGFYWAGAYASDSFVVVGTDDGKEGYRSGYGSLLVFDPETGKLIDSMVMPTVGDIRCSICYDEVTDAYYFTTKGGEFYQVRIDASGNIDKSSLRSITLKNGTDTPAMSTSTPVIYNGRAYVGVSGSGQFTAYSGHNITVIDLSSFSIAYSVETKGYIQTSGLLSTASEDGYVYVYFAENYTPGMIRYIKDKPGMTEATDSTASVLFTPVNKQAQYCICSLICDEYGTLYLKNDSAYMMAVGADIESIEITDKPDKLNYEIGETFNPEGMKVIAHLSNGIDKDVTDLVTYNTEPLTALDTELTISYPYVLYGDRQSVAGEKILAPETYLDITFGSDQKEEKGEDSSKDETATSPTKSSYGVVSTNNNSANTNYADEAEDVASQNNDLICFDSDEQFVYYAQEVSDDELASDTARDKIYIIICCAALFAAILFGGLFKIRGRNK